MNQESNSKEKMTDGLQCYRIMGIDCEGRLESISRTQLTSILGPSIINPPSKIDTRSDWRRTAIKIITKLLSLTRNKGERDNRDPILYSIEFQAALRSKKGQPLAVDMVTIMNRLQHHVYQSK